MNTKKRFYLCVTAACIGVALIVLFSLSGCQYFAEPVDPPPDAFMVDIRTLAVGDNVTVRHQSTSVISCTVKAPAGTSAYTHDFVAGTTDGSPGNPITFTGGNGITAQFEVEYTTGGALTVTGTANGSFTFMPTVASQTFTITRIQ